MRGDQLVFLLSEIYRETYRKGELLHDPSYLHLLQLHVPWSKIAQHIELLPDPVERLYLRSLENQYLGDYLERELAKLDLNGHEALPFEKAVFYIGLLHNPLYKEENFFSRLSNWEMRIRERMQSLAIDLQNQKENFLHFIPLLGTHAARLRAQEIIRAINGFLFETMGLIGEENCFYETASHCVQSFLEQENLRGIPISLSAIYLILARRLGLPIYGVNMPRHFLIKWETNQLELFLDPFHGGRIIPKDAIIYLLKTNQYPLQSQFFSACNSATIIRRMLSNLSTVFQKIGWTERWALTERLMRSLPS
ncbi:MAG: transglutaminase-like domain-containing protein [Leptospiraceae bacterium]|nr:transglutaminase-like domain-containing protein [Leptospiraceae bacterium]MDW8306784.1 transglutaminase-like domain-containing protein [Leptospiraceae bacterium]